MSISNLHRNSTEANKHTPKGFTDASNNSKLIRDERGESRYVDNINIGTFIDFADPTLPPPTTTNNHVYVLVGAGTVDADWGSAVENDVVRFFDNVPISVTPTAGYFGYNLTENKYYRFTTEWVEFAIPPVWGSITGTLSDQTDLQTALDDKQDTLISGTNIKTLNGDSLLGAGNITIISENIATNNLSIPSTTTRTLTIPSDSILDLGANVRVRNNILELQSVTRGFLMNRVTTIQMNAIVGMSDNELVFNTDVKAIYRYDATLLQWVALSSGYGIIAVYSGSGSGVPTFFATLQSALETCKASGGYFTVKLYSNLTITSAIEIDYTGSGTGKAYLFRQLTIDFNGFSVINAQANTTDAFTLQLSNTASVYQEVRILNGTVLRTNGTGTHHALKCDQTGRFGTIQMSKMLWYCQNGQTARIGLGLSTAVDADRVCDLGGSTFISNASGARTMTLPNSATTVTNFRVYHTGALDALYMDTGRAHNFYAENTSTGKAILAVGSNFIISQFDCKSNSGIALDLNGSGAEAHNFTAKSTSGEAVSVKGTAIATLFKADTGNNHALRVEGNSIAKDAFCQNNSATLAAVTATDYNRLQNIEGINLGASFGGRIQQAQALRGALRNCTFISIGGIGAEIISTTNNVNADNCNFESQLDSSSGHALRVQSISSGTFTLTKCNYTVRNSSANCLNASGATTVRVGYNTHNNVASTPVNANITLATLGKIDI
jgi:hypothetical protein